MEKRVLKINALLALCLMAMLLMVSPVMAAENTWNPDQGVYKISTVEDLKDFRNSIAEGVTYYDETSGEQAQVTLENDITINEGDDIGTGTDDGEFRGYFNGNGHKIIGFNDSESSFIGCLAWDPYEVLPVVTNLFLNVDLKVAVEDRDVKDVYCLSSGGYGKVSLCGVDGKIQGTIKAVNKTTALKIYGIGTIDIEADSSYIAIENCYTDLNIEMTNTNASNKMAKLNYYGIRLNTATQNSVKNCYSAGTVKINGDASASACYGIAAIASNGSANAKNCYYDASEGKFPIEPTGDGTAITSAENMKKAATFTGFDFNTVWTTNNDTTTPQLLPNQTNLPTNTKGDAKKEATVDLTVKVTPKNIANIQLGGGNDVVAPLKADYTIEIGGVSGVSASDLATFISNYNLKVVLDKNAKITLNPYTTGEKVGYEGKLSVSLTYDQTKDYTLTLGKINYVSSADGQPIQLIGNGKDGTIPDDTKQTQLVQNAIKAIDICMNSFYGEGKVPDVTDSSTPWYIMTMARSGYEVPQSYYDSYYQALSTYLAGLPKDETTGYIKDYLISDYVRPLLAVTAIGYDPRNVGGVDLLAPLMDIEKIKYDKDHGNMTAEYYALIGLDACGANSDKANAARTYLVNALGTSLAADTSTAPFYDNPDMAFMQMQAVAPYYKTDTNVKTGVDSLLSRAQAGQNAFGGWIGFDVFNPCNIAQVIAGAASVGDNVLTDTGFIKNGYTLLDAGESYFDFKNNTIYPFGGGTYGSNLGQGQFQLPYAFEGALRAMGKSRSGSTNRLYDMTDVKNSTMVVNNAIAALPATDTITDGTKAAAKTALDAVDGLLTTLSDIQKISIDMTKYNAVKAKLTTDTPSDADKTAAKVVTDQIVALGTITLEKEATVTAARSAYNALTDVQKALVKNLDVLKAAEEAINALKPQTGTVTIDVERFTIGQGFYKEPVTMAFTKDETVFSLVSRLVGADNILGNASYMTGIKGTDAGSGAVVIPDYIVSKLGGGDTDTAKAYGNKKTDSALGTASYSAQGGWMFLVNNQSPTVGMGDYKVSSGDVIRIAFSYWGYGADLTGYEWGSPEPKVLLGNRDQLLKAIAAVNTDGKDTLLANSAVKTAYDNAIAVAKDMTETTENAQKAADALNQAVADMKAAKAVADKIAGIKDVSQLKAGDKAELAGIRSAYKALTDNQKKLVTNLDKLTDAETKIGELETATPPVKNSTTGIEAVGLPAAVKNLLVENKIADASIKKAAETAAKAKGLEHVAIVTLYDIKPDMSDTDLKKFNDDPEAYITIVLPIPADQQGAANYLVYHLKSDGSVEWITPIVSEDGAFLILKVNSFSSFGIVKGLSADEIAAKTVVDQIAALPTTDALALTDKAAVTAARNAYAVLTPAQQALVTNLNTLTAAEAKIKALEDASSASNNQAAADAVIAKINALGTISSYDQKAAVVAARSAYNGLTVAQKALISNDTLTLLKNAEAAIEKLKPTTGSITIDVERFTIGQGFYVEPMTLSIKDGETARQAIEELLGAENLVGEVGYLRAVTGADAGSATIPDYIVSKLGGGNSATANAYSQKYAGNTLGEFDYSKYSGWMYFVNNQTPSVGMNDYTLKNGDVMRLAFTYWGTGTDLTGLEYGTNKVLVAIANKDSLIKAIATAKGNSAYLQDATIKKAYDTAMTTVQDMTASQKTTDAAVTALNKAIADYKPGNTGDDTKIAKAVTDQIAALPAVAKLVLTDKAAVTAARTAYDGLSEAQKKLVTNLSTLTAAEAKITELQTAADQVAAKAVTDKIAALPTVAKLVLTDKDAVAAARAAYDALSEAQKKLVTNLSTLTAAEAQMAKLLAGEATEADKAAAKAVSGQISGLPSGDKLTLGSKADVAAARAAYNALTDIQKTLITNLDALAAAETRIAELEKATPPAKDEATGIEMVGLPEGVGLKVEPETGDADKTEEAEKAATEAGIKDAKVVSLYNIKPDMSEADLAKFNSDPDSFVTLTMPLGDDQQGYDSYKIYHKKTDGTVEWITPTLSADKKSLIFKVNAFSEFGVVATKASTEIPAVDFSYRTHVQNVGWQDWKNNGAMSGTRGQSLRLEGIEIKRTDKADVDLGIRYETHIENIGWEDSWKADGKMSGTEGRSLRLEAIRIELTGADAANYDVYYQVHAQNTGWMAFAKNGADAGTAGFGYRLEGIHIIVVPKGQAAPTPEAGSIDTAFLVKN